MVRSVFICLALAGAALGDGDVAKGKELFRTCAGCHSVAADDGKNPERKMGPSLRTLFGKVTLRNGRHVDDESVREIVLEGFNGMPSFRYSMRPAEIDDLMAYLHTLTGRPAQSDAADGEKYFRSYCLRCHNPDSRTATGPDLRGRYQEGWMRLVEDGHADAGSMKDWMDGPAIAALMQFLKSY